MHISNCLQDFIEHSQVQHAELSWLVSLDRACLQFAARERLSSPVYGCSSWRQ